MRVSRTLAAGLAAAAALAVGLPSARGEDIAEAISLFQDRMKTADSMGKRNAVAEIGQKHDPKLVEVLRPFLRDKDVDVRVAVAQVIGEQKDPKVASALISMYDVERKAKDESKKLLAALIEGVGEADAKGQYKFLSDALKKWINESEDVAIAAAKAMGHCKSRDTVDDLVKLLLATESNDAKDSAQKRAARSATRPVLIEVLQAVTGKDIKEVRIWKDWWSENSKTWKPAADNEKEADLNAGDTYTDDAYGYTLKKPSKAWSFKKEKGQPLIIEALEEGGLAARLAIQTQDVKTLASKTPDAMAEEQKKRIEELMKDIKGDETEWSKKTRFAGETACEQVVFGRHKDYDACLLKNVYIVHDGVMYMFYGVWKSGKPQALREDLDRILSSFKFTGR